jgi:hypothetical protein
MGDFNNWNMWSHKYKIYLIILIVDVPRTPLAIGNCFYLEMKMEPNKYLIIVR